MALRQQMKQPAGPALHAALCVWVVGGVPLNLYAVDKIAAGWCMLLMAAWIAACVKLGTDQDKRRGIAR